MSALYGELEGAGKTIATRRGHPQTGINAHIRGWNRGVYTSISAICEESKKYRKRQGGPRRFRMVVAVTGGGNDPSTRIVIHTEEWEE